MKTWLCGAAVTLCLTTMSSAFAHHSFASFNLGQVVDVKGTVKEFRYTNPHAWIILMTKDASGKEEEVFIEANGPGYLVRAGWHRNSLMPGDDVTVSLNPMRDGSPGGSLVKVTFADGHELKTR